MMDRQWMGAAQFVTYEIMRSTFMGPLNMVVFMNRGTLMKTPFDSAQHVHVP